MDFEEYIERYGIDVNEVAKALLSRIDSLDNFSRNALYQELAPGDGKSASQTNLLNLVDEAQENLALARKLRDSIIGKQGELLGTVGDVTKTLMAVDKCLDGAAKRFQTIYSVHSQQAVEECVKETLQEMSQEQYERFMWLLEDKLRAVR
jgi:hypothetical protein